MAIKQVSQEEMAAEMQPKKPKQDTVVAPAGMDLPDAIKEAMANQGAGKVPTSGVRYNLIELPSRGKCGYPETIGYRDILVRDEKILASATNKTFQETVGRVLKSLLEDQSVYQKLTIFDRDYLLTWIWANNYSTQKSFTAQCPHCATENDLTVDLVEIGSSDIKDEYPDEGLLLPLSCGETVRVKMLTVADEEIAAEFMKKHKQADEQLVSIVSALEFEREMNLVSKVRFVEENMTGKEMAMIRAFYDYFKYGMLEEYEYNCHGCGEAVQTHIPFSVDHFLPTLSADFKGML